MNVDYEVRTKVMNVLKEVVTSFDDILEHGSLDDVRAAVSTLIDKIEIDDENVYIYWAFE